MALDFFGYTLKKKEMEPTEKSFVPPTDEGSLDTLKAGGHYGTYLDLDGAAKTERELIKRYRDISLHADVKMAIEDIVDEAFSNLENEDPVALIVDDLPISTGARQRIREEFDYILRLMHFDEMAHDLFRRWYVDGRIYFHKVIDEKNPSGGITDIRYIDPRKIKKVRNIVKEKDPKSGVDFIKKVEEFFVYNPLGMSETRSTIVTTQGLKIQPDSITFVGSGLVDRDTNMVLSYLHPAIKPANQLRMMENALVIYRLARAPERRIFYIDTGNLPRLKAEQYIKDQMNRYRNKMVYDADTGQLRDDKKYMSMLEDFWLARREGGRGTEVGTLPGGDNLGKIDDIIYFQKKLYQSLSVPISRLEQDGGNGFNLGRASEISREEIRFTKFIEKLKRKFSNIFRDMLRTQLILKGLMTDQEWQEIKHKIKFRFSHDAYYVESKDQELLRSRFEILGMVADFEGRYVSREYIQKKILRLTDEEIEEINSENESAGNTVTQVNTDIPDPPELQPKPKPKKK